MPAACHYCCLVESDASPWGLQADSIKFSRSFHSCCEATSISSGRKYQKPIPWLNRTSSPVLHFVGVSETKFRKKEKLEKLDTTTTTFNDQSFLHLKFTFYRSIADNIRKLWLVMLLSLQGEKSDRLDYCRLYQCRDCPIHVVRFESASSKLFSSNSIDFFRFSFFTFHSFYYLRQNNLCSFFAANVGVANGIEVFRFKKFFCRGLQLKWPTAESHLDGNGFYETKVSSRVGDIAVSGPLSSHRVAQNSISPPALITEDNGICLCLAATMYVEISHLSGILMWNFCHLWWFHQLWNCFPGMWLLYFWQPYHPVRTNNYASSSCFPLLILGRLRQRDHNDCPSLVSAQNSKTGVI